MNCREFERVLPELACPRSTAITPDQRREAQDHSATCVRCSRLLAASRGEAGSLTAEESEAVVQAVLRRTSGASCRAAQEMLPAWVDDCLSPADAELLAGHVGHCPTCRSLADTLGVLRRALPALAEVDPGPAFTFRVLEQTSRLAGRRGLVSDAGETPAGRRSNAAPAWITAVRETISACHRRGAHLMRRPRAALELAYGTSLVLCLVVGSPATRIEEVSSEITALAARVPSPHLVAASVVPENGWEGAAGNVRAVFEKVEARTPRGLAARVIRAWKRISSTWIALRDHGPVIGKALLRLDLVSVWREAEAIRQSGRESSEPRPPSVRPEGNRGMAAPGGADDEPAARKGGTP